MNLGLKTASGASTIPSRVAAIHRDYRMVHPPLDILDRLPGIPFVPLAIEGLGREPKFGR